MEAPMAEKVNFYTYIYLLHQLLYLNIL